MNPPEECTQSSDGKHRWMDDEDGSIVCLWCDQELEHGHQPHKEDRHHAKKIPS